MNISGEEGSSRTSIQACESSNMHMSVLELQRESSGMRKVFGALT